MSKVLSEAQTGVRVYLDEANAADFTDAQVTRSINYAYHDVVSEVMEVYEEYYLSTTPLYISTAINTQEYTLDSTVIKTTRVEINYDPSNSNSKPTRAKSIKLEDLPNSLSDTDTGGSALFGCGYYIIGRQDAQKIGFVPIPTKAGTNNVSVWGLQAPADLSAASDNINIPYPDRFTALIELKAAADLLRKGQQAEGAALQYMKEYMIGVSRMKTFLKERQSDGPQMIVDSVMEDVSFDSPL